MNVIEKLNEILGKPIFPHDLVDPTEAVADYPLDNGVTVQEWIPVTERLPDSGVVVLTYSKIDGICLGYYDGALFCSYDVTHWMPLPEPPKGE